IDGEPADVVANINRYSDWLSHSDVPKLFINATPGMIIRGGRIDELIRSWSNLTETTVNGSHFVQEDSPDEIGAAVAQFVKTLRSKDPPPCDASIRHREVQWMVVSLAVLTDRRRMEGLDRKSGQR